MDLALQIGFIGRLEDITVRGGPRGIPRRLRPQPRMDIVHADLKTDGPDGGQPKQSRLLLVSKVTSIDAPAIRLLNSVSVDLIIQEKRKIREEVELIILPIGVGKELPSRWSIVMVVQAHGAPESVAALRWINGTETVERAIIHRSQRNLSGRVPLRLVKARRETELITAGEIRGHLAQEIRSEIAVVVQERPVRVVGLSSKQGPEPVLRRREHQDVA